MKRLQQLTVVLFFLILLGFLALTGYTLFFTDREPPVLQCSQEILPVSVHDTKAVLLQGVTATDDHDGDLTDQIMIQGITPLISADTAVVSYVVFDRANHMATGSRTIQYTDYRAPRFTLAAPLVYQVGQRISLWDKLSANDVVDGDLTGKIRIASQNVLSHVPGTYRLTLQVSNSIGDTASVPLNLIITDGPLDQHILLDTYLMYLQAGDAFDPMAHVQAVRNADFSGGDLSQVQVQNNVDPQTPGVYDVHYTYASAGSTFQAYLTVVVE